MMYFRSETFEHKIMCSTTRNDSRHVAFHNAFNKIILLLYEYLIKGIHDVSTGEIGFKYKIINGPYQVIFSKSNILYNAIFS